MAVSDYTVELSRWGIVPGAPAKPYKPEHYVRADNNVKGIQNAIAWAYSEGYGGVKFPKNTYAVCYPRPIQVKSIRDMVIDWGGATLDVMFDSDSRSPFDNVNDGTQGKEFWRLAGTVIELDYCKNVVMKNLLLYGDRNKRSFRHPQERTLAEHTYGIKFKNAVQFCTLSNVKAGYFSGDSVTFVTLAYPSYAEFALNGTRGDIQRGNGAPVPSGTSPNMFSRLMPIVYNADDGYPYPETMAIVGSGFERTTRISEKEVGVFFYNAAGAFLGAFPNRKVHAHISIPTGAVQYRLQFYKETNTALTSNSMGFQVKFGPDPHHNLIRHCEFFGNGRGGMTPGGSYNAIEDCIFRDMGVPNPEGNPQGKDIWGLPTFNYDGTKYGINQEDSFGDNTIISRCTFHGLWHAVMIRGWNFLVENCRIYNCGSNGINIANVQHGVIRGNYIYETPLPLFLNGTDIPNGTLEIADNTIVGGNVNLGAATGYDIQYVNNKHIDVASVQVGGGNSATPDADRMSTGNYGNRFKYNASFGSAASVNIDRLTGAVFAARGEKKTVTLLSNALLECTFENLLLKAQPKVVTRAGESVHFSGCRFNSADVMSDHQSPQKSRSFLFKHCTFTDAKLWLSNTNTNADRTKARVEDCRFIVPSNSSLTEIVLNAANGPWQTALEMIRCRIEIAGGLKQLYRNQLTAGISLASDVLIEECEIEYLGASPLTLLYAAPAVSGGNAAAVSALFKRYSFHNNKLRNVILTWGTAVPSTFYTFNTDNTGTSEPSDGYWSKGDRYRNANTAAGQPAEWVCVADGIANNTAWKAGTAVRQGDRIHAGGRVYECVAAGTTGAAPPAFSASPWATTIESTGVRWLEIGMRAAFKPVGTFT